MTNSQSQLSSDSSGIHKSSLLFDFDCSKDVHSIGQLLKILTSQSNLYQYFQPKRMKNMFVTGSVRQFLANNNTRNIFRTNFSIRTLNYLFSSTRMYNCADIDKIHIERYISSGWTKSVFKGVYRNKSMALKTVDINGQEVTSCVNGGQSPQRCYKRAARKIVKEIILLRALVHENIIQVSMRMSKQIIIIDNSNNSYINNNYIFIQ